MDLVTVKTATAAWELLMEKLGKQQQSGFIQPSRAGNVVGEILNSITVIEDPTQGFVDSPDRNLSIRYAIGELMWYLSGSNQLSSIQPYSKFWNQLSDDGETLNSAYGHRIYTKFGFDQWEHVKEILRNDPLSRQAVIHIKDADNTPTKDLPCTLNLQFHLREGQLHMTASMRSNDIWLGFPFDVFCFTSLQIKMAMELGVKVGEYTHFAGSLHLYERNVKTGVGKVDA